LKELQSKPKPWAAAGRGRQVQALIEITPSQRNFVFANFIHRPGLFAFPGQGD
jgi:hypothetical protein